MDQVQVIDIDLPFEEEKVSVTRRELRAKLNKLVRVTQAMIKKVGAGHKLVLRAKMELKRLRKLEEQLRWTAIVSWHKTDIERAEREVQNGASLCELEDAVQGAYDSELGHGHSIVIAGKRALTVLIKARQTEANKIITEDARRLLKRATESGNLATLDDAIEATTISIGRGHPYVQQAVNDRKRIVFDENHRRWHTQVSVMKEALIKANENRDEKMLSHFIREASQTIGGGHPVVTQGKKWLDIIKKRKKLAFLHRQETEAKEMLNSVLDEAEHALEKLEVEVAEETHLSNVYIGRGGGMHLNDA